MPHNTLSSDVWGAWAECGGTDLSRYVAANPKRLPVLTGGALSGAPKCEGCEGYYRGSGHRVGIGVKILDAIETDDRSGTLSQRAPGRGIGLRLTADGPHGGNEPAAARPVPPLPEAHEASSSSISTQPEPSLHPGLLPPTNETTGRAVLPPSGSFFCDSSFFRKEGK
jgi:hypothetical protein